MKRRLFPTACAISFALWLVTSVVWLKHAVRREFNFGGPIGIIGGANDATPSSPRLLLKADNGFELATFRAKPEEQSPIETQWIFQPGGRRSSDAVVFTRHLGFISRTGR